MDIPCVILAAGKGSRMFSLTENMPKVMLPVANKPIIQHLIESIKSAGITDLHIIVGYKSREVVNFLGDGSQFGVHINYITQWEQNGTGDAVLQVESEINDRFVLVNGDTIFDKESIETILREKKYTMGISASKTPQNYGVVGVENGKITSLVEKPDIPRSAWVNTGIYNLDTDIFKILKSTPISERGEIEITTAISSIITEFNYKHVSWNDISYPWDILDLNVEFIRKIPTEGRIGNNCNIREYSVISEDVLIGNNVTIGPHAYIRNGCSIGNNCHIGHSTEVKNSVIMGGTKLPHFNYVGDSVIGRNCNFGSGTKIANVKFDGGDVKVAGISTHKRKFGAVVGDGVNFGINCSVNVGSVVGSFVNIYPHTYVTGSFGVRNNWVRRE